MSDTGIPAAMVADITSHAVASVATLIRPYVLQTPVAFLDRAVFGLEPGPLVLKLEQLQHSGSFKARGAFANLLLRPLPEAGVVAASGGNHGAAVAYAAQSLGVRARVFVPRVSSPAKIERIRGYGADLVVGGAAYAEALAASEEWAAVSGALPIPAFDQVETILGGGRWALSCGARHPRPARCWPAWAAAGCSPGSAPPTRAMCAWWVSNPRGHPP